MDRWLRRPKIEHNHISRGLLRCFCRFYMDINGILSFQYCWTVSWLVDHLFMFMFVQFIITSRFKVPIYDPVGKYYGSFLFLTVFISLISISKWINTLLTIIILIFSAASLGCRFYFLLKHEANGNNLKKL